MSTYIKQISIPPETVLKKLRTANFLPWQFKWPEHLAWIGKLEVRVSLKPKYVLSQKRCISTQTSLHVSKKNAIAIAQLIFQMLSVYFQNNIIMSLTYTLLISGIVPNLHLVKNIWMVYFDCFMCAFQLIDQMSFNPVNIIKWHRVILTMFGPWFNVEPLYGSIWKILLRLTSTKHQTSSVDSPYKGL